MKKSELLAIKVREYERGLADAYKKFRITERDLQGWAEEAWSRVHNNQDSGYVEDAMRDMLIELGVEIIPSQEDNKGGNHDR